MSVDQHPRVDACLVAGGKYHDIDFARRELLDLLYSVASMVHWTLDGMAQDVLRWQPDKEANNIAVTVWHFSRAFDVFKVRLFENQPATEELWHKCGWGAKKRL